MELYEDAPHASPAMAWLSPQTCFLPILPRLHFLVCEDQVLPLCEGMLKIKGTTVCAERYT